MTPHQRQIAAQTVNLWATWIKTTPNAVYEQLYPSFKAVYGTELSIIDERLLDVDDPIGMWPQILIMIAEQIDELTRWQQLLPLIQLHLYEN